MLFFITGLSLLFLRYKLIPNKAISTRSAFAGGVVSTLLWEVARTGFSYYSSKMVGYDQIYGTLGVIPLFLLWLYLFWMVVLIGMEVTYIFQNWRLLNSNLRSKVAGPDSLALGVLRLLGLNYRKGCFTSEKDLVQDLLSTELEVKQVLVPLIKEAIITPIENQHYTLAKAPEHIHLWNVVSLFHDSFQVRNLKDQQQEVVYLPLHVTLPGTLSNLNLSEWLDAEGKE